LIGIRLPGYCLPLLFHKVLTVHRCLEASDLVAGESASRGRVRPNQCSEPERSVACRFLVPAKGCEASKLLLAHTSNVAVAPARARRLQARARRWRLKGDLRSSDFLPCAGQKRRAQQRRQVVIAVLLSHSTRYRIIARMPGSVAGGVFISSAIAASAARPPSSNVSWSRSSTSMKCAHALWWDAMSPNIASASLVVGMAFSQRFRPNDNRPYGKAHAAPNVPLCQQKGRPEAGRPVPSQRHSSLAFSRIWSSLGADIGSVLVVVRVKRIRCSCGSDRMARVEFSRRTAAGLARG
jgi:hypothetical protein